MHSKLAEYREKRAEQQAREVSAISPERTTVDNSIKPRGQNDIQISKKDEEEYWININSIGDIDILWGFGVLGFWGF